MLPFAFVRVAWGTFIHGIPVRVFFFLLGNDRRSGEILINMVWYFVSTYNENNSAGNEIERLPCGSSHF